MCGSSCFSHNQHTGVNHKVGQIIFPPKLKIEIMLGPDSDRLPLPGPGLAGCGHCSIGGCHLLCHPRLLSSCLTWTTCSPPDHWLASILRQHWETVTPVNYYQWIMSRTRHKWWTESVEIPLCWEWDISVPWSNPRSKPKPGLRVLNAASLATQR